MLVVYGGWCIGGGAFGQGGSMVWATLVGSPNRKVKVAFNRCVGFGILTSDLTN